MTEIVAELSGVLYDKLSRSSRPVYLRVKGNAMSIDAGSPGEPPLGIWGPTDPRPGYGLPDPERPVDPGYGVPEKPRPGGIWGPGDPRPQPPIALPPGYPGAPPHVEHPIVLPPTLPDLPAPPEGATKPPPEGQAGWGYYDSRWGYFPGPQDAGPKA